MFKTARASSIMKEEFTLKKCKKFIEELKEEL
jgi:hypothetical protein